MNNKVTGFNTLISSLNQSIGKSLFTPILSQSDLSIAEASYDFIIRTHGA